MGVEGLEPSRLFKSTDFKSVVSTIPPYPHFIKATPRFELGIEDLQSTALPLGHTATYFYYNIFKLNMRIF